LQHVDCFHAVGVASRQNQRLVETRLGLINGYD
jgi:hypothetical protein